MTSSPDSPKPSTGRTLRLARKELREILRDRRTVLTLVLMPLLVYPLLGIIMRNGVLSNLSLLSSVKVVVCVENEGQMALFSAAMLEGKRLLEEADGTAAAAKQAATSEPGETSESAGEPTVTPGLPVVSQEVEFEIYALDAQEQPSTLQAEVENGGADLAVVIRTDEVPDLPEGMFARQFVDWTVLQRDGSSVSARGYKEIGRRLDAFNEKYRELLMDTAGLPKQLPFDLATETVSAEGDGVSPLVTFIPLVLVLMTMTGAVYPAIDLTAGERERGTMEILVSAPVSRMTLLAGKFVAVLTVAVLTASMNLLSMFATLFALGLEGSVLGNLSVTMIVQVVVLMVVFAAFFSAVLLSITSIARSFKEAQAYLIPLMLISLTPGVFSLMPNLKINSLLAVTPLVNTVLMGRDLLQGNVDLLMFAVVLVSTALYGMMALSLAARIFGSDAVLYSSGGSWNDLLRRPEQSSAVAPLPVALFSLAIVFSLFIVAQGIPSRLGLNTTGQFVASGGLSILLFVATPLAVAVISRVRMSSGFALRSPQPLMWVAAVLLGFSLWPFVYELEVSLISQSRLEELKSLYDQIAVKLDEAPFWSKLFALAIAPAVCEEFFFRGFLQNAVRQRTTAVVAVVTTGVLFGLFHVIVRDALMYERLLPSALMGMVLGIVFERTGSVLPGMLMHLCHNGFLVTVAHYEDTFAAWGIGISENQHLPLTALAGAAVPILIAGWLLKAARPEQENRLLSEAQPETAA
ncbi:MAG: ABC transporter permease subunit [Planctomycetaceae bacterium]|nr:ABC transporter permease subunit [Planctomycetaceae bacterium]